MFQSNIAIITDSSVNFPQEIARRYPITVLPLSLIWGNETLRDAIDISPDEFYQRLASSSILPSTSQITPAQFEHAFRDLLQQGKQILCILISAKLSGTYAAAVQAQALFPGAPIEVIDSNSASMAVGFQCLEVARLAEKGASFEECKALAEKSNAHTGAIFCVDTLEFLHRGGRIGAASRFIGTALDLKPILELRDGTVQPVDRVRTLGKAHDYLINLLIKKVDGKRPLHIAVIDAKAHEAAEKIMKRIHEQLKPEELLHSSVSPVIGCHTGPGTIGLVYLTEL